MADYQPEPDADAVSPALRIMLVEWRRTRIQEANSIARLIGLEVVMTTREHERRRIVPRDAPPLVPRGGEADG